MCALTAEWPHKRNRSRFSLKCLPVTLRGSYVRTMELMEPIRLLREDGIAGNGRYNTRSADDLELREQKGNAGYLVLIYTYVHVRIDYYVHTYACMVFALDAFGRSQRRRFETETAGVRAT